MCVIIIAGMSIITFLQTVQTTGKTLIMTIDPKIGIID